MFEEFLQVHGDGEKLEKLKIKQNKDELQSDSDDSGTHSDSNAQNDDMDEESGADKLAEKPISDLEYMKMLMKSSKSDEVPLATTERKPRQKTEKKVKEKITLFNIKVYIIFI